MRDRRAVIVALGLVVLAVASVAALDQPVTGLETAVFEVVNRLPGWLAPLLIVVMQAGAFYAVPVTAVAAALLRRFELARALLLAGGAGWLAASLLKSVVGRGRPTALLQDVLLRVGEAPGLGFPSGHTATATALVTAAMPFVGRRVRVLLGAVAVLVGIARMYVGVHLPLDVLGGGALGLTIGTLVWWALPPSSTPDPDDLSAPA